MSVLYMAPELQLPWESSLLEDARYRKILRNLLLVFALLALIVPLLPVEQPSREQQEALPPQLARVLLEAQQLPKPVPVPPKPKPKPKVEPKPEPEKKVVEAEKPKPKPKVEPKPVPTAEQARELAAVSGVLAFQDTLMDMRDSLDVDSLNSQGTSSGQAEATAVERSIITGAASGGSGGIKTAALSRDTGGPALSGRETTRVESVASSRYQGPQESASAALGGRSDESIRRTMDSNKGGIFAVYNRALRQDPTLQGKLVFEMEIEASGVIAKLQLISSELLDDQLTQRIIARIRMIKFAAEDVITTRVNYSFDFLPY